MLINDPLVMHLFVLPLTDVEEELKMLFYQMIGRE
jgi:hypothetical protein